MIDREDGFKMKHLGAEVPESVIAIARRVVTEETFTLDELRGELLRAGVKRPTYLAQRFLQAERRAGRIAHVMLGERSYWKRIRRNDA